MTRSSISIEKRTDGVFEVTVAKTSTTTHTVIVTDQSLNDLTYNNVTKTQLLEFSLKFLLDKEFTELQSYMSYELGL